MSKVLSTSAIEEANKEVKDVLVREKGSRRLPYLKATPEKKAIIGKNTAEHGVVNAIRRYEKDFVSSFSPNGLKESIVRGWKNLYQTELELRLRNDNDLEIKALVGKKPGRPLLLGDDLNKEVQAYLRNLHNAGCPVNTAVPLGAATGLVHRKVSNLLAANGGHILLTRGWAQYLLNRMGFVKRKASSAAKVPVEEFADIKAQ